jgi:hypothetical protein
VLLVIAVAAVVIIVVGLLTGYVGYRALAAKQDLEQAQAQLSSLRVALGEKDQDLEALYAPLQASTTSAVEQTHDPVWSLYEHTPWLGPNLAAVRQTAELIDTMVRDGVGPMATAVNGLSVDSLKPAKGRVDIAPLKTLAPAVVEVDDAVRAASVSASAIDTSGVVPQVASAVDRVRTELAQLAPVTHQARTIVPLLYPLLGGEGTRHYLLMFQNNAEERASGGNPASMALLTVDDGRVKLGRQASSADFPSPYGTAPYTPTGAGNQDWDTIYTDYASTYLTNITMTPDFPSTAKMARAMWLQEFGGTVDGVISFDPIALSYLLNATGPITLSDGTTIDASNAVSFLLYDVYATYADGSTQDAVFASAARSIFTAIMSGKGEPRAYLAQLGPMVDEQRLKVWSTRRDEQRLLLDSPVGTMLPADNRAATVLGVYNNDDATSKMSYFTDQQVAVAADRCLATPTYTVTSTVTNTLKKDQVAGLPDYVRAHQKRIPPGGDRQWVQLYGPVGGKLQAVYVDGVEVVWGTNLLNRDNTNPKATGVDVRRPAVQGMMHGRPVGVVSITLRPGASKTVKAVFSGTAEDSATVEVSHTPKVRETPVTVTSAGC